MIKPPLISVAPMLDWTDRHCRFFLRLISKHILLYTEMITTGAIIHGDRDYFLTFNSEEHPVALQLGGSDPKELAQCAKLGKQYGYDEINLNVGCPSSRVSSGMFGACLMAQPELVATCMKAMQDVVDIPVTLKTRIGIDDKDSYEELTHFIQTVADTGCNTFIIHARKAWLSGLSPKENRTIPPLRYDIVEQLKKDFPRLTVVLNGGIHTYESIGQHLINIDGIMIGREAYQHPYFLAGIDAKFYDDTAPTKTREAIIEQFIPYVEQALKQDIYLKHMAKHLLGLFHGQPGARHWRRYLSEHMHDKNAGVEVIRAALDKQDIRA